VKSFLQYLRESFLLENRAWHQFVDQNRQKLLDRAELTTTYNDTRDEPGHVTPEHLTNHLTQQLGMEDLTADEGRWVLIHLHNGGIERAEDVKSTVIPNIKRLRQAKTEGKSDSKLKFMQGAGDLHAHLNKIYPVSDESLTKLNPKEYTIHGENEHWTVVQPHTKDAACAVGRGTNWCTASTGKHNRFRHYNNAAPLYALIPKNPVRKGERYQIHMPDSEYPQFMDENDRPLPQEWSPLNAAKGRPLPEIKDETARKTLHTVRDIFDIKLHGLPEHIAPALSHDDRVLRRAAARSPHFGPEHMGRALSDDDWLVREAAARSPHFGPEHMETAFSDDHWGVRIAAARSPHFGPEHMETAFSDDDWGIRLLAAQSRHFGPKHMETALSDKDWQVRLAAVQSPHFGPEHMGRALADNNSIVRLTAEQKR